MGADDLPLEEDEQEGEEARPVKSLGERIAERFFEVAITPPVDFKHVWDCERKMLIVTTEPIHQALKYKVSTGEKKLGERSEKKLNFGFFFLV